MVESGVTAVQTRKGKYEQNSPYGRSQHLRRGVLVPVPDSETALEHENTLLLCVRSTNSFGHAGVFAAAIANAADDQQIGRAHV